MRRWIVLGLLVGCASRPAPSEPAEPDPAAEEEPVVEEPFEDEPFPYKPPEHRPEPDALPLPTTDLAEAWKLADDAVALGEYATAVGYFKSIYEIYPRPEALFNIAQCLRWMDDCYGAAAYYRRYLEAAPGAKNRETVEERLAELDARCPPE